MSYDDSWKAQALERVYNRSVPTDESLKGLATVLDVVRRQGATTRTQLIQATGLSRAVVSQRVAELVEYGLLTEDGLGPSTGGRAPRRIRFRAEAAHLLVADLGATSVDVAVADLAGGILGHEEEPADIAAGPEAVLDRVEQLFERCLAASGTEPADIWGIGIGVPGPVEFASGRPVAPPIMPGWDGYPIRERFARYGVPVWVDNDVNVLALGELHGGVARGFDDFVFVKIGTGIGAGIVVARHLHRGAQGSAGDVGHIQVGDGDREVVCRCGNVNCLEAFAGGAALARDAEQAARDGRSPMLAKLLDHHGSLDARAIASAAAHGDSVSSELITAAGRRVGGMLAGIVNFFNPPLIVIGGGVARVGDTILASIRESVYRRSLPLATRDLVVKRSALEGLGGVVGAAAMVTDELFAPSGLEAWLEHGTPARTASGPH